MAWIRGEPLVTGLPQVTGLRLEGREHGRDAAREERGALRRVLLPPCILSPCRMWFQSVVVCYPWNPFSPEAGPSRSRSSHAWFQAREKSRHETMIWMHHNSHDFQGGRVALGLTPLCM